MYHLCDPTETSQSQPLIVKPKCMEQKREQENKENREIKNKIDIRRIEAEIKRISNLGEKYAQVVVASNSVHEYFTKQGFTIIKLANRKAYWTITW
jgi:hypothetical protein